MGDDYTISEVYRLVQLTNANIDSLRAEVRADSQAFRANLADHALQLGVLREKQTALQTRVDAALVQVGKDIQSMHADALEKVAEVDKRVDAIHRTAAAVSAVFSTIVTWLIYLGKNLFK